SQWGDQGIVVCDETGNQNNPLIVTDGSGGAIVVWNDERNGNYDIYCQRLDSDGVIQWASGGVCIVTKPGYQYLEGIIPGGGAIVSWTDYGDGLSDIKVEVQRIDAGGSLLWAASGVPVSNAAGNQEAPCLVPSSSGGAIVAWQDSRGDYDIYAQSISAAGAALWDAGGVAACTETEGQYDPAIVPDGAGGVIIAWTDYRKGDYRCDIYAQRLDGSGASVWKAGGVPVCTAQEDQWCDAMIGDGYGGAIIAWGDYRSSVYDVYAQRIDSDGVELWSYDGVAVCTAPRNQWYIRAVSDGAGGAIVSWVDSRSGVPLDYDIYAQRLDASGLVRWAPNGAGICTADDDQSDAEPISDGAGGAFLVWEDRRSGDYDIYASRIDTDGDPVATLLAAYSIDLEGMLPRLTWTLIEEPGERGFFVFRSADGGVSFDEISDAAVTAEGRTCIFVDTDCVPGTDCIYRVEMLDEGERTLLFEAGPIYVPDLKLVLRQNHPNPFNPSTTIEYVLPSACRVFLAVYDPAGRLVVRLVNTEQPAGPHAIVWNGRGIGGKQLPSGIYFYRLQAGKLDQTRKMLLLR
ncbi:MAG: T9SS type A sorting domain-containing protein, partial [Candidatus Krumholzibacteria bacterium]|nr:T9SS type A sorting domain-containing protein [Candidatus Krumholzibacteria bacterium]